MDKDWLLSTSLWIAFGVIDWWQVKLDDRHGRPPFLAGQMQGCGYRGMGGWGTRLTGVDLSLYLYDRSYLTGEL